MGWEIGFLDWIQTVLQCTFLDIVMPIVTKLGDAGIFWILLTLVLLILPKTRQTGVIMAAALIFDVLIVNVAIKPLVARTRPYDINTAVQLLVSKPIDYSFPSGHTAASFASVAAIFLAGHRKGAIAALLLSLVIAFSRLYLYVHFPTDVLGGMALGILAGMLGYITVRLVERYRNKRKSINQ